MVAPDVQIEDGKGTILISSEEGETEGRQKKNTLICYFIKTVSAFFTLRKNLILTFDLN